MSNVLEIFVAGSYVRFEYTFNETMSQGHGFQLTYTFLSPICTIIDVKVSRYYAGLPMISHTLHYERVMGKVGLVKGWLDCLSRECDFFHSKIIPMLCTRSRRGNAMPSSLSVPVTACSLPLR